MIRRLALSCVLLLPLAAVGSEDFSIRTGKWEFTTTTIPPVGESRTEVRTECVTDGTWKPEKLLDTSQPCRITDSSATPGALEAEIRCDSQMGAMTGQMSFRSDGDTATGNMQAEMSLNGQVMRFQTEWKGKRVGDCD